ncbi:allantoate amidohydrolase [Streptomyces sp. ADI98-10]|uniref:allantoate amidohydrolase n=1 Tax=Streptomyces sp. ADI98-10 TaxID=1522763 RepID=UPI000F54C8F5|nr:allantoate amidohydrolase [Streptomyces sp. ADI98-10]RPK82584.1 N-carbamoyl-L-amino acid hydrolase [Streptomyces sp. ADI98-10]
MPSGTPKGPPGASATSPGTSRQWRAGDSFLSMWRELAPVGLHPDSGGYRRYAWSAADVDCRAWFRAQAEARGLTHESDRNGNQWAWLGDPLAGNAVVTGSHLDSVPDGGAFDGPLGVVSSFAALDELHRRGVEFTRPLAITNFGDEEGARFGLACVGSRLAAGQLAVADARRLRDADGVTLPAAMERAGYDPGTIGPDPQRLARIGAFVELHVEQGRALDLTGDPVGIASAIWPHGRWRFDFRGEANHAGTTRLADRRDPMLTYAETVLAARREAELTGALATFGKIAVEPNGVNAIPSLVRGWLDSRAADQATLDAVVTGIARAAREYAERAGIDLDVVRESFTPVVEFEHALRDELGRILEGTGDTGRPVPVLGTGAGHDAGILSASVPTAMLFVRNPTGISHSPAEHAAEDDCTAGIEALADVLEGLACS